MACNNVSEYNFEVIASSDNQDKSFTLTNDDDTPVDLNGFTGKMQLRPNPKSSTLYDELTTANGRITIVSYVENTLTYWRVTLKFPGAVSELYDFEEAAYNLKLIKDGLEYVYMYGIITISPSTTR